MVLPHQDMSLVLVWRGTLPVKMKKIIMMITLMILLTQNIQGVGVDVYQNDEHIILNIFTRLPQTLTDFLVSTYEQIREIRVETRSTSLLLDINLNPQNKMLLEQVGELIWLKVQMNKANTMNLGIRLPDDCVRVYNNNGNPTQVILGLYYNATRHSYDEKINDPLC